MSKDTPRTKGEGKVDFVSMHFMENVQGLEEMQQQWENQKVKYVEEIQNLSIELKKKNRIIDV